MRNLHTKFKWLATDANGKTFAYVHKPVIQCNGWGSCHPCDLVSTGEPTKDWQNTLNQIDHFADVPERFKFIGITKFGLKFATTHKPTILQSHWGTDDVMSECITVGNLSKYCNDWGTSLIEREEQKPVDLRTECKTLRKQLGDSEQSRVSLQIKNAQLEKELSARKSVLGALDENAKHLSAENKKLLDATAQFHARVESLQSRNDRLLKDNAQLICERQRLENQLGASEILRKHLQTEAYESKTIVEKMREVLK